MGSEEVTKKKEVFDSAAASAVVSELRGSFSAGKTRSYKWRVAQLKSMFKMLDEHEPEIVAALRDDIAKPEFEGSLYEVGMLKGSIRLALKELKNWMAPEKAKTKITTFPSSAEIVSEPLGVVLIISAWNYPFLLSLDPVVGAIAAGNALVLKPSEIAPASSSLLAKLVGEYMDSSCIRVVEGAVAATSSLLEQKWDKIFYTGNARVARIVMAAAAKHLTPVVLELGGKSPVVVDSDINLQVATRRIIMGKWGCNNGQACISPDYVVTTKDYAPKLVDSLKCELEKFFGEKQLESKDLSRIVNSNHFTRLSNMLDDEKVSGKIVHGGERDKSNLRIAPTILLDVPRDSLIMSEEIFGPLLPILTVDKIENSFDIINAGSKPLAAYLFTNNKMLKQQFVAMVSAGGVVVNDTTLHLAVSTLPFGGVQESGMGSYHGKFSFDAFSHKKAVLYRSFAGDAPLRYPPYTQGKLMLLKAVMSGSLIGIIRALLGFRKA
ncbi:aldehyde dehydrogenase family 3 member H1-like [Mangifera indica]|uniref:aldehyde dehydrogenase family 3 member H1-like n=1 Tax=Mangifera indica TaxID=29780 RepID=UPI001CF998BA|nr:aldehyde dehydrogenase family 3 member H1-like [Mangifera indica]